MGSAEVGDVLFENEGELYLKPTCVGTSSVRQFHVTNTSRVPLHFDWRIPSDDVTRLKATPQEGVIEPGERQVCTPHVLCLWTRLCC